MKMEVPTKAVPHAAKAKSPKRWHGAIEGVYRGLVYGWAIDAARPGARVVLEVCLNDEPLKSHVADVVRTDLLDVFNKLSPEADACHGFVIDANLDPKAEGILSVRVANTAETLDGSMHWAAAEKPSVTATSHVFSDGALRLHGWAIDATNEKRNVIVSAYVGNDKVAEATANLHLPSVRGTSASGHAFTLDLPLSVADGVTHTVRVVDEQGLPINGSPLTVCSHTNGIRALLPQDADAVLDSVADMYERHLPRSLGFQHYRAWQDRFETGKNVKPSSLRVAMLVVPVAGNADQTAALAATVASLKSQYGAKVDIITPAADGDGFSTMLEQALAMGCDVIGCIRAGDTLREHALAQALAGFDVSSAQLVYSDSEYQGKPWFKPAWNPDYAFATDYPVELMLIRSNVAAGIAAPPPTRMRATKAEPRIATASAFAWAALAATAKQEDAIVHVPHVLYQFNSPLSHEEIADRNAACTSAASAIAPDLKIKSGPNMGDHPCRRVTRPLSKADRKTPVSLVIPTRDYADMLKRCLDSIRKHTDWPELEIIVIDNGSVEAKTKSYFRAIAKQGVRVLPMPGPFNFADLNNRAIAQASGEIVGLINNDIEALHDGWLDEIVGHLLRPGVGAVGAKLLWPNGMVQHGGVLMGVGNAAGHYGNLLADQDLGDHGRNQLVQQVTGVTAACLFMHRSDYIALGGMDPIAFPVAFNDVDLCLKIRASGKSIVWTPHAKMLHAESASRGQEDSPQKRARALRELEGLRQRWGHVLTRDPAYHPSVNLDPHSNAFGGLAVPPRDRTPRTGRLPITECAAAQAPATIKTSAAKPKARTRKTKQA